MDNENLKELKDKLTINQIYDFLISAGGEPQIHDNVIVSRTICHNPPGEGSHKLYYYDNTKLFKCYTDCPENSFDIFQLVLKIKRLANENWELPQAINYVLLYFGIEQPNQKDFFEERLELQDWKIFNKIDMKKGQKSRKQTVSLPIFSKDILQNFPTPKILPWLDENISQEIMSIHNICYNPIHQSIIIPHYNINNELIGIRERTLLKENEINGKYIPAKINGKMYNHPLSFNLYNINFSKDNIKKIKKAIVFEGEKSSLKYGSYFGIENDISVAACGSNLIDYQVELLLSLCAEEIIVAFDKQFQTPYDEEWKKWTKKLTQISKKYNKNVVISFMFDKTGELLKYKDSPIDEGKEIFIELFNERLML